MKLALVGKDISRSKSPSVYKKLLGNVEYRLLEYDSKERIPPIKEIFGEHNLDGVNITSPYKGHFLDQVEIGDDLFKNLGVINCIKKNGRNFEATNTDYPVVEGMINKWILQGYEGFVLLGDGAMAKVTSAVLKSLSVGFEIFHVQYSRRSNGSLDHLNLEKHFNKRTVVINSCSGNFVYKGKIFENSLFWDYNYGRLDHENRPFNYLDGYSLLWGQAIGSLDFFKFGKKIPVGSITPQNQRNIFRF